MVFISRPIISERTYVGLIRLVEIALVRSTYARWCGGTAVKAASYPIYGDLSGFRVFQTRLEAGDPWQWSSRAGLRIGQFSIL
jgi:hypothetical protein